MFAVATEAEEDDRLVLQLPTPGPLLRTISVNIVSRISNLTQLERRPRSRLRGIVLNRRAAVCHPLGTWLRTLGPEVSPIAPIL